MAGRSGEKSTLFRGGFRRGVVRDTARHAVPADGVYDALDFLVDRPGVAYKRGGSGFQSSELTDETSIIGVAAPEFLGDPRVVVIASDGADSDLYDVTTGTAAAAVPVVAVPAENPPLYFDKLILTDGFTGTAPQKAHIVTGVVVVDDLGGAPPKARVSCVHLDYLVLANSPDNPNRIWFGPVPVLEPPLYPITAATPGTPGTLTIAGDHTAEFYPLAGTVPAAVFHVTGSTGNDGYYSVVSSSFGGGNTTITVETLPDGTADGDLGISWDVFDAYIDAAGPVVALASVAGILIVFMRGTSQRILGSIPPGFVGENMELQPLDAVGCIDARSVVQMGGLVYFANEHGVYETNGATAESVTSKRDGTGIGTLWAAQMEGFAPALGAVVCAGVWLNKWLFLTIRHPDGPRSQWLYYQPSGAWMRLSDGVTADSYATRFAPSGEIYAACGDLSDPVRLLRLSPLFEPTTSNESDANGEPVEPLLELPFGDAGVLKQFQNGRLTYMLTVASQASWAASHVYGGGAVIEANGQIWTASAGTSGLTEPAWATAPQIGNTVVDNTVTWTNTGPQLIVSIAKGVNASAFADIDAPLVLSAASRAPFDITANNVQAVSVRVTQSGPSAQTEIYSVDTDVRVYEPGVTGGE